MGGVEWSGWGHTLLTENKKMTHVYHLCCVCFCMCFTVFGPIFLFFIFKKKVLQINPCPLEVVWT